MTQQRDLKRRVRARQARTGESYMTALRHVRGELADAAPTSDAAPTTGEPGAPTARAIPVVELVDCSDLADTLGLTCRVMVMPVLVERIDPGAMLRQLRDVLRTTAGDPMFAMLRSTVLLGGRPSFRHGDAPTTAVRVSEDHLRFAARVRAGVGGVSSNGRILALVVHGRRTSELVVFGLWQLPVEYDARPPALIVTTPDQLPINVRFDFEAAL